jgi:hypothetical protein
MKVLEINLQGKITCQSTVPADAEITAIRLEELSGMTGEYELIFAMQVMQYIERGNVNAVARKLSDLLSNGGELWVTTPCLEWAAHKIMKNEADASTQFILFGNDDDPPYHSGYTLLWLRSLIESTGLITRKATQGILQMEQDGKKLSIPENTLIAMRFDAKSDAALAVQ